MKNKAFVCMYVDIEADMWLNVAASSKFQLALIRVEHGFNSVQFTSLEILLNQTFQQSAAVFFSGWEYSGCGGYKVNGVTGDDEVVDVTGDDVW